MTPYEDARREDGGLERSMMLKRLVSWTLARPRLAPHEFTVQHLFEFTGWPYARCKAVLQSAVDEKWLDCKDILRPGLVRETVYWWREDATNVPSLSSNDMPAEQTINWDTCSDSDFIQAVQQALSTGKHLSARNLATHGHQRFPNNAALATIARILAPQVS